MKYMNRQETYKGNITKRTITDLIYCTAKNQTESNNSVRLGTHLFITNLLFHLN